MIIDLNRMYGIPVVSFKNGCLIWTFDDIQDENFEISSCLDGCQTLAFIVDLSVISSPIADICYALSLLSRRVLICSWMMEAMSAT